MVMVLPSNLATDHSGQRLGLCQYIDCESAWYEGRLMSTPAQAAMSSCPFAACSACKASLLSETTQQKRMRKCLFKKCRCEFTTRISRVSTNVLSSLENGWTLLILQQCKDSQNSCIAQSLKQNLSDKKNLFPKSVCFDTDQNKR